MRFLHPSRDEQLELALEDVFLVPGFYDGGSRLEVDLTPQDFPGGSHPVVSANMNAVTGKRMAETIARFGGLGVLPQDMAPETVERIVAHVRAADPRFDTALSVTPRTTLRDVAGILRKRAHDLVVVLDDERRPIGVVTDGQLRGRDQYTAVGEVMTRAPVTLRAGTSNREAFAAMEAARVKAVPIVDDGGRLGGVLTRDDTLRLDTTRPALDRDGRLMVGVALGISAEAPRLARRYVEAGASFLVLDTAHAHQRRMLETLRAVREELGDRVPLVAGNVCTAEGTTALLDAGADVVKVNVGPGAMCTTRMQTGAGRPTFSSVQVCAAIARARGRHVWADGGVRWPRDVALYLAAGAARVMIGTWLAGTYESPGDIQFDADGLPYKENWGMASARAVHDRNEKVDPFERAKKAFFREGISTSRIYLEEGRDSVGALLTEILTGVLSSFTYAGARTVAEYHERAVIGVQTPGGFSEGKPHGAIRR